MTKVDGESSNLHPNPKPGSYSTWSGPPGKNEILTRQGAAIPAIILLYTASVPFTPFYWVLSLDGGSLFDRLVGGIAILAACYFQWRIAGLTHPMAIIVPGSTGSVIRDGRIERGTAAGFVWYPSSYWHCFVGEVILLSIAEFGPSELLRRAIVCGVVAALWLVGYGVTPESTKKWAFEHIKAWMFWIVLDKLFQAGGRGHTGRRRRR